ncbi:PHD finger protein 7-like [Lathamus discolor]|uniref:PHD finger protein 7-like n=1 Tax=Lathamus discolor TaxID=678569 RepID=UPI0032B72985
MEQTCMLCRRAEADPDICGPKVNCQWVCAHRFCLLFASDLRPRGTQQEDQTFFHSMDFQRAVDQAAQMVCFVCGERGATIACQGMGCDRRFHLPCAVEGGCVTRYLQPYRACIQGQAMHAGMFSLQCHLCQNTKSFLTEMLFMGIRIPVRQASWEDNNAYAELYQRHTRCDATECLCPGGRGVAEPDGLQCQVRACWSKHCRPSIIAAVSGSSGTGV